MLATIQRVSEARVSIEGKTFSEIGSGLLIFVCIEKGDSIESITSMVGKIINFKMLDGFKGSKPRSLKDANEEALVVSQFTLAAITNKGNKPSFHKSAKPEEAKLLYDELVWQSLKRYLHHSLIPQKKCLLIISPMPFWVMVV